MEKLFRDEVLQAHSEQTYGKVLLVHPISHYFLAALGLALIFIIGLFLAFGHYTKHATVQGVLEPVGGVVKLYAPRNGQLRISHVHEAQFVHKGDVLMEFTSEHAGISGLAIESQSEAHDRERLDTLRNDLQRTAEINRSDDAIARDTLASLLSARTNLLAQIQNQQTRIQAAQNLLTRYEELEQSGFMPSLQVQEKRNDVTEQQVRLQGMQRDLIVNNADIARANRNISSAPMRQEVAKAQIERDIASTEAELGVHMNMHDWSVIAPCDGTVSALAVNVGQSIDSNTPLISLVPSTNTLQATLYASSRELGFVKLGQPVKIKVEAFPYQKFGLVTGKVTVMADSPILPTETSSATHLYATVDKTEPLYTISVALDRQTVEAYGKAQALRPGMQLAADIELDERRLVEWMLEPLFSMRQN